MNERLAYFAADGNYGTAIGLEVVDTARWTKQDWAKIEEASDSERAIVAKALTKKRAYYPLDKRNKCAKVSA